MHNTVKEGDLYKAITVFGRDFELRYGYYTDIERESPFNEVTPIYPDFKVSPTYTDEGFPFVTQMQDVCAHYDGKDGGDDCYGCKHFRQGEELIGICVCDQNKNLSPTPHQNPQEDAR